MKYSILLVALFLTGCIFTNPIVPTEPKVVKEVNYVIKVPPKESLDIPVPVKKVDVDSPNVSQADVATYIVNLYKQNLDLTNKLVSISKFFNDEQQKLNTKAAEENLENKKSSLKN